MSKYYLLVLAVTLWFACSSESEFERSVFIKDPVDQGLPIYSEWGYNTFGAYYDRAPFTSEDNSRPAKITVENNATSFILDGRKATSTGGFENLTLMFEFPAMNPITIYDLAFFNQKEYDLEKGDIIVSFILNGIYTQAEVLEGSLNFTRYQNLIVDKKSEQIILSGRFSFTALVNGIPISVNSGRFDVGIGPFNFFRY